MPCHAQKVRSFTCEQNLNFLRDEVKNVHEATSQDGGVPLSCSLLSILLILLLVGTIKYLYNCVCEKLFEAIKEEQGLV